MAFYAKFMVSHGISNIIDGHNRKMRKCCTYKFQILNKTVFKEAKKLLHKFLHGVFAQVQFDTAVADYFKKIMHLQKHVLVRIHCRNLRLGYLHTLLNNELQEFKDQLISQEDVVSRNLLRQLDGFNLKVAHIVLQAYLTRCQYFYSREKMKWLATNHDCSAIRAITLKRLYLKS